MRYFVHDLETEKLHIHTGGKSDWLTLPEADRNAIKRACLWSNRNGCWVSRCKGGKTRILDHFYPSDVLARNGFEDRGTTGEKLTFAEQIASQQRRAEERAERMESRADKAQAEAESRFNASHAIIDMIPMGQPILIGHHSEKRHRRDLERSDNHMRKGCEAIGKRDYYQGRAEAARATADGSQYSDPGFLGRRIEEAEADLRKVVKRIEEIDAFKHGTGPDTVNWLDRLLASKAEIDDKIAFLRHCMDACGAKAWDRESLKGMKQVLLSRSGMWQIIVRLNPKTVAVPNICFPEWESQCKYALKYPYADVRDAR